MLLLERPSVNKQTAFSDDDLRGPTGPPVIAKGGVCLVCDQRHEGSRCRAAGVNRAHGVAVRGRGRDKVTNPQEKAVQLRPASAQGAMA